MWASDGSKSAAARLSRATGTAKKTASRLLHRASTLGSMPTTTTGAAMPDGALAARPLFVVHVGDGTFAELCELAIGTVITPAHLAPFLTDAAYEVVLFDGPTTVVLVSRQRSFTRALRRAIEARDRSRQHPSGCDVPADQCDVDHIIPYAAGGPTAQHNGRLECPTHNRNTDEHDHGASPLPERQVTRADEQAARHRWRLRRAGWNVIELALGQLHDWEGLPRAG